MGLDSKEIRPSHFQALSRLVKPSWRRLPLPRVSVSEETKCCIGNTSGFIHVGVKEFHLVLKMDHAQSSKDMLRKAVGVFVKTELGAERVSDSWNAYSLRSDRDKGSGKDRVALISGDSAVEDPGGKI